MLGLALICFHPALTAALLACGEARQEQLFRSWEKAKADTRSLVVEFTLEHTDRVRGTNAQFQGTAKLLRTAKGELLASYTLVSADKSGKPAFTGLMVGGTLYLLDPDQKMAVRIEPASGDVRLWLEQYFNPLALLLDEKRARAGERCRIGRLDQWYTYINVNPPPSGGATYHRARAVFMNTDGDGVPKDMPRQLWYQEATGDCYTFDIRSWKANAADGPKPEEFTRPEDRPGWQVRETAWPSWLGAKPPAKPREPARKAGYIYIVGNDITYQSAFLDLLGLYPGTAVADADLRAAERRLAPLALLGIRCSVSAMERAGDNEYVDILVRAKESPFTQIAGRVYNAMCNCVGWVCRVIWYLKLSVELSR